jgi:hypothetical protein
LKEKLSSGSYTLCCNFFSKLLKIQFGIEAYLCFLPSSRSLWVKPLFEEENSWDVVWLLVVVWETSRLAMGSIMSYISTGLTLGIQAQCASLPCACCKKRPKPKPLHFVFAALALVMLH